MAKDSDFLDELGIRNKALDRDRRRSNRKEMEELYTGEGNPFLDSNWSDE